MFVYRDSSGKITDVLGSICYAELEELQKEYGEAKEGAEAVSVEPDVGPDETTMKAFEEAKALEPEPEPEFKSALDTPEESEEAEEVDELPKTSDSKATWIDYAVAQGSDREEAESMTKQELVDFYLKD
jgi:hypothetical protein